MEGSESGGLVPSDTILEVETWVKLSNFPAKFLTAEAISYIVSFFASPVTTDEDTYEKVENHKRPPKLRRKLHSRKTFVTICVRVSVTEPLPPCVIIDRTNGGEYFIPLDFDPTPKVCLQCLGAGHFDFECCGTDKESVENFAEAGGGFEEVNDVAVEDALDIASQLADCCDTMCEGVDDKQGAFIIDGVDCFEDSCVVEAVITPAATCDPPASCDFGAATSKDSFEDPPMLIVDPPFLLPAPCDSGAVAANIQAVVGDLVAVQTISDGFDVTSTGERAAVLEVVPLLPCCDIGPAVFQDVDCWHGFCAFIVGVHGAGIIDGAECYEFSPVIEAELDEKFHNIEQVFSVVICPKNHHKWRDKSDVLGLDDQGLFSVDVLVMWLISRLDFGYAGARCWIFCLWMLISFRF